MKRNNEGNLSPETFLEAYTMAKQKANALQQPVSYAGFYIKPSRKQKKESLLSRVVWIIIFISSCYWGPLLLTHLFGNP